MKKTLPINLSVITVKTLFMLLLFAAFSSCSRKTAFNTSAVVPAAQGHIKVTKDNNNNYKISVRILHLAGPDKLQPPRKYYVVWMTTDNSSIKNLGKINSSSGFLSKTLKASLEVVTAFKPEKVFVTAEDDPDVLHPGMQVVLETDKVR